MLNEPTYLRPVGTAVKKPAERPTEEQVIHELEQVLTRPAKSIADFLQAVAFNGGKDLFKFQVTPLPVFRVGATSGYNYCYETKMLAYLRFGVTTSGYFIVQSMVIKPQSSWVSHYYGADGKFAFTEGPISHTFAIYGQTMMEPHCPIINHLYHILSSDYLEAKTGPVNTIRAHTIEQILRRLDQTRSQELSVSLGSKDSAIEALNEKMMVLEPDPVYTWKERFRLYKSIKAERATVIDTKKRAHHKSWWSYSLPIFIYDLKASLIRFKIRPWNNLLGAMDRLFIDPIRWFGMMVRNNLGLSIAMAIYSPFTFFFISQPLNPHATWAVGKVRSAYIESTEKIHHFFFKEEAAVMTGAAVVNAGSAGEKNSEKPAAAEEPTAKPGFFESLAQPFSKVLGKETVNYSGHIPGQGKLLLTTDVPEVNQLTWDERMSHFKAMQIGYESGMEIASRLGRLEQMETQLNWPLIVESAWIETGKYLDFLTFIEKNPADYQPNFVKLVKSEIARTEETQLYLWDRNIRFILDHPYTLLDQSQEQTQMDYYIGRAFIMLKDMTSELSVRHKGMKMPNGYDAIMKLAHHFESEYQKNGGIMERLRNNSKVFAQKDKYCTQELRSYMQRQWEVLYLLQNHAQEGSNAGLQTYIWSIRNAVWILQSLYSTKKEDLSLLALWFRNGSAMMTPGSVNKVSNNLTYKRIDSQYEALFHDMVLEYTSVRKEIGENLKKDIEATQRKTIMDGVESFFNEREVLLKGANLL